MSHQIDGPVESIIKISNTYTWGRLSYPCIMTLDINVPIADARIMLHQMDGPVESIIKLSNTHTHTRGPSIISVYYDASYGRARYYGTDNVTSNGQARREYDQA
ncbi:hypothetical protein BKA82DRAFT_4013243 [Pisolithus tinctorius]|nr:hypothetical protein BKA82DRAFT_4013243 [Pisolithus tinctorius]